MEYTGMKIQIGAFLRKVSLAYLITFLIQNGIVVDRIKPAPDKFQY